MQYRKHIRLKHFDYDSDGAYFITMCTHNRLPLLDDNKYKLIIEDELRGLIRRFSGVQIDYCVLMPNHVHLILFLIDASESLPRIIQAFKSLTTLKIKRSGYEGNRFWQPNYYEHVIRNEKALDRIRQYVIDNPMVEEFNWKELDNRKKAKQALPLQCI